MPKVPKLRSLLIFTISAEKYGEVAFLATDKHEPFLQVDCIPFGVRCQVCPNYPMQVYNIFAISQGKRER